MYNYNNFHLRYTKEQFMQQCMGKKKFILLLNGRNGEESFVLNTIYKNTIRRNAE